jgi:hypothetical protein
MEPFYGSKLHNPFFDFNADEKVDPAGRAPKNDFRQESSAEKKRARRPCHMAKSARPESRS